MTGRTNLIGLVSNNFDNPASWRSSISSPGRLSSRPCGRRKSVGRNQDRRAGHVAQYNVDGVIIASSTLPTEFVEACAAARLPVVHAFGRPANPATTSDVGADNIQGGVLAGEILLERGYRRIAFLGGPQTASSTADRLHGLRRPCIRGTAPSPRSTASYSHEAGLTLMRQLLEWGYRFRVLR
jgi:DNA-binding LacI/PurR family transcriptional regulator